MFDLIKSIRSDLTSQPIQPTPATINERLEVIKDVVNRLYTSVVPQHQANISVSFDRDFDDYDSFSNILSEIRVPAFALIDPEEIPVRFRFSRVDDPRFDDTSLLQEYSNWLCDKLEIPRKKIDKVVFQSHLFFMRNRQKATDATKFVITHELGHYHHSDSLRGLIPLLIPFATSIVIPITAYLITLGLPFFYLFPLAISAGWITSVALLIITQMTYGRFVERRADMFAAKHCPNAIDGGIYSLESHKEQNKRTRRHYLAGGAGLSLTAKIGAFFINSEGDITIDFGHPPLSKRIAALEAFKRQRQPQPELPLALNLVHTATA